MLELACITSGHHVLDIAAGAGEQSITTAKKVSRSGYVLATDISLISLNMLNKWRSKPV
jgi:ubiquinone/menaquinone biosynthesis C-methylase UbiE